MRFLIAFLFCTQVFAIGLPTFDPIRLCTNCDMSQGLITTGAIDLTYNLNYSIQAVWTGSPVGTIKLQVTNDIGGCGPNWSDYSNSSQVVSGAGDFAWIASQASYHCVRVVYTRTSGSGTLNVTGAKK